MTDPLPIHPFRHPLCGQRVRPPGSKSITNRALIIAALSRRGHTTRLSGALFSRDTRIMCEALRQLGYAVDTDEAQCRLCVTGQGRDIPRKNASLHIGNAGTAARFLTAMLAVSEGGTYDLDGDEAMRLRPMRGLLQALQEQGTTFTFHDKAWHFPFRMQTQGLRGGTIAVDASASSQILSAIMLAAPLAATATTLQLTGKTVSEPFVQMTEAMMRQARAGLTRISQETHAYLIPHTEGYAAECPDQAIEPDATAASYFMTLPLATGGHLFLDGMTPDSLQGDWAFFHEILPLIGVERDAHSGVCRKGKAGQAPLTLDFNAFSDTFLTLAAIAPLLPVPVTIEGIAHTRHQETDRIQAMATELTRLGVATRQSAGALTILPPANLRQAVASALASSGITLAGSTHRLLPIETYEDHRVAMAFGILGCHDLFGDGRPWLAIRNPSCCGKTFPDFFDQLDALAHACAR